MQIVDGISFIVQKVVPVDSIYKEPKPVGQIFFRDSDYQWSKDSKYLYLIKDTYDDSKVSQLYSKEGELWRFEIETANLELVISPFPAFKYFLGPYSDIYFSTPIDKGDLQLRFFDGINIQDIGEPNAMDIPIEHLPLGRSESIFFSFSMSDYTQALLPSMRARLVAESDGPGIFMIGEKVYLSISHGMGAKGSYYGYEMLRSVYLPGEKYFLLNVNCKNYRGQLLIDTDTGKYMKLPKKTRVYQTINTDTFSTDTFQNYQIMGLGIEPLSNIRI